MPRVLLIHAGPALPALASRFGDFDRWFERALEGAGVDWTVVRPFRGEALPAPEGFAATIVTGSHASVREGAPWMAAAARWIRDAVERDHAVLGVCFGHQLLCHAFGARVIRNPNGFECGTPEIALTEAGAADPLFAGMEPRVRFHQTHEDVATDLPPALRLLAGNPWTPVQAVAVRNARGVQFHPEMTEEILRLFAELQGGPAPAIEPAPAGPVLLRGFLKRFAPGGVC